jgi:hypothetical protein
MLGIAKEIPHPKPGYQPEGVDGILPDLPDLPDLLG